MATGPPPTTNGPTNTDGALQAPTPPVNANWEGDRMFNIYVLDYCNKRGYQKTALQLASEADIPADSSPPINAKQGLLFEWWSVFWVLFNAKSSGTGSPDALVYTQHHAQQRAAAQRPQQMQAAGAMRYANGVVARAGGPAGIISNGAASIAPQPGQNPMSNGASAQMSYAGPPHVNGATPQANGPTIGTPGGPQVPRVAPQQPQRPMNGTYQRSPTMAPSPQTQGGPAQGAQQQPGPGSQQTRPMMPPNTQVRPGNAMSGGPQHTPQPVYQQLAGATPSHPNSPAQNSAVARSPSFANRQPLTTPAGDVNNDFWGIDSQRVPELRMQLGIGDNPIPSLTQDEKRRMIDLAKQKGWWKPNTAGPSNLGMPMQRPPQQLQTPQTQARSVKRSSTSPGHENNQASTNDTSPPANKRVRRTPPGNEPPPPMTPMLPYAQHNVQGGQHHMPNGVMNRQMATGMPMNFPVGVAHMSGNPMMPMNPQPGGPHMSPGMANPHVQMNMTQYRQTMQAVHKPGAMTGLMPGNQGSPGSSNNDPSGSRPGTSQFAPPGMQGQMAPGMQGQLGPSGMQQQLGPPGMSGQRPPIQNKQGGNMMPPPPQSPAMKNAAAQHKDGGGSPQAHSSPRNAAMNAGPGPSQLSGPQQQQGQPGGQHMGTAPPTPVPAPTSIPTPTPAAVLNSAQQQQPPPPQADALSADLFGNDFLNTMEFSGADFGHFDLDNAFGLDGANDINWMS